jgi:hypothetical protein
MMYSLSDYVHYVECYSGISPRTREVAKMIVNKLASKIPIGLQIKDSKEITAYTYSNAKVRIDSIIARRKKIKSDFVDIGGYPIVTTRVHNALVEYKIESIKQLLDNSPLDLLTKKNVGWKSLNELIHLLDNNKGVVKIRSHREDMYSKLSESYKIKVVI